MQSQQQHKNCKYCCCSCSSISTALAASTAGSSSLSFDLRNADHTTGQTATGVACCFAELVTAETEVVLVLVHDHSASDHAVLTDQRHQRVRDVNSDVIASGVDDDVAEVTDVSHLCVRGSVGLGERVEVWTSRDTAVAEVTVLVNVEAVLTRFESL